MAVKIGVVMDPIQSISVKKDTTLAMLLAAQRSGWELHYMLQTDLYLDQGQSRGLMAKLTVRDDPKDWYTLAPTENLALAELDVILMRKDPPFDMDFVYSTYILEQAQREGVLIVNDPRSLRDCNEKLFATQFPQCCPPLVV
jgi:glutathione synthase